MWRSSETRAKTRTLPDGVEIPYLGFGTYLISDDLEENWSSQNLALTTKHLDRLESLINQGVVGNRY